MGLLDRLNGAKKRLWSPITVWMAETGSDKLVRAGEPALVVVEVQGEDDGTAERVELFLKLVGLGIDSKRTWPLAEVPKVVGRHELRVTIPPELPPSCASYAEYTFESILHRTKGTPSTAASRVDVVAREEDLYWPDGPRHGGDGITVELDAETVEVGGVLTGRATTHGKATVRFGPTVDTLVRVAGRNQPQQRARFKATTEFTLADDGEFRIDVPEGVPPTLHNGGITSVVWKVEVQCGDRTGWALVGVLDPEATAGTREAPSPSLASFLSGF
jgi:hypothetical protein